MDAPSPSGVESVHYLFALGVRPFEQAERLARRVSNDRDLAASKSTGVVFSRP